MGTTLHAVVEEWFPAVPEYQVPESWGDVAQWEFEKDYALMFLLSAAAGKHNGWPKACSYQAMRMRQDGVDTGLMWFASTELPDAADAPDMEGEIGDRYLALRAGLALIKRPTRVLFYTM